MLVGADGLHSAVRAATAPGAGPLLHSGTVMWRGVTETPPFLDGRSMLLSHDDRGTHLIAYPIRAGARRLVNWVLQNPVTDPGPVSAPVSWNRPGSTDDVLPLVRGWDLRVLDVDALVRAADSIFEFPMVDRDPLATWRRGRITLLGDAAHPMYPVGANGATQAILDAHALAEELSAGHGRGDDPVGALDEYERRRREPTAAIVRANREMDRAERTRPAPDIAAITDRYRAALGGGV